MLLYYSSISMSCCQFIEIIRWVSTSFFLPVFFYQFYRDSISYFLRVGNWLFSICWRCWCWWLWNQSMMDGRHHHSNYYETISRSENQLMDRYWELCYKKIIIFQSIENWQELKNKHLSMASIVATSQLETIGSW